MAWSGIVGTGFFRLYSGASLHYTGSREGDHVADILPPNQTTAAPPAAPTRSRPASSTAVVVQPALSVVVVNHRQWTDTGRLVHGIIRSSEGRAGLVEAVVVDNRSCPHSMARRLRRWKGVSLRRWGRNRGFARAVNEGCRLSRGPWILLLNPDITLSNSFLTSVLALAEELSANEPRTGIVGFRLEHEDGTFQLSSGRYPTLGSTLAGLFRPRATRKYRRIRRQHRSPVPWVSGCCLLIRRDCFRDLGGLDEDYFLYYEDVDLCRRARRRGWSVWYDPALTAIHHRPLHCRPLTPFLRFLTRHGLLTYAGKYWPRWQVRLLAGLVWVEASLRRLVALRRGDTAAAGCFRRLREMARQLVRKKSRPSRRLLATVVRQEESRLA